MAFFGGSCSRGCRSRHLEPLHIPPHPRVCHLSDPPHPPAPHLRVRALPADTGPFPSDPPHPRSLLGKSFQIYRCCCRHCGTCPLVPVAWLCVYWPLMSCTCDSLLSPHETVGTVLHDSSSRTCRGPEGSRSFYQTPDPRVVCSQR